MTFDLLGFVLHGKLFDVFLCGKIEFKNSCIYENCVFSLYKLSFPPIPRHTKVYVKIVLANLIIPWLENQEHPSRTEVEFYYHIVLRIP